MEFRDIGSGGGASQNAALVAGAFAELDGNGHFFAAAIDGHGDVVAGALVVEDEIDVQLAGDCLAVDGHNDVATDGDPAHACFRDTSATLNPGGSGRPSLCGSLHEQALLHGQVQRFAEPAADGQRLDAEKCAVDAAVGDEVVGDILCRVDGNGEADASGGAAGGVNRGVDADDFTARIDERPAGIAAVDGRVGLDSFVNESGLAGLHGASERADNAGSERGLESERIADGEDFLAHLE